MPIQSGTELDCAAQNLNVDRLLGPEGMAEDKALLHKRASCTGPCEEDRKGRWRLVWCYERCHKAENVERCTAIRAAVNDFGGSLICLKKAGQFVYWLQHAARPHFILITDWREAQPCMQYLMHKDNVIQPACSIIICNTHKQFNRATAWARRLPSQAQPVIVVERCNIPPSLLDGLVYRYLGPAFDGCEVSSAEKPSAVHTDGCACTSASEEDNCSDEGASSTAPTSQAATIASISTGTSPYPSKALYTSLAAIRPHNAALQCPAPNRNWLTTEALPAPVKLVRSHTGILAIGYMEAL